MRGRDAETRVAHELLQHAERGHSGVLLVDGEWGIGKSLLLRETAREAAARGFSLAVGDADPLRQVIPFAALLGALDEPLGAFTGEETRAGLAQGMRVIRARLERRASAAPVLVSLDDLQWASPGTLLALRVLPGELSGCRLAWILARSAAGAHNGAETLFSILADEGATRIALSPLDEDAVEAVLTDSFGAPPDRELRTMAFGAAGIPLLLTELIQGLRAEGAVEIADGCACLLSSETPRSVHLVLQRRIDGLSARARHFLRTAAVLGQSFLIEDAAAVLGEPPVALLSAVEEVVAAGIIVATDDAFSFRGELIRSAAERMTPQPARKALRRQFGEILLNRGEPALAAPHLLEAVHRDDPASLAELDRAAAQTLDSSPQTAARVTLHALELTPPGDPDRLPRSVAAAEAVTAAGRLEVAAQIIQDTAAHPLPPDLEARLRCAESYVRCMSGQADWAAAEAEAVLAEPLLAPELRDQALSAQMHAVAALRSNPGADRISSAVLAAEDEHSEKLVAWALAARAMTRWGQGQISSGLELLRDAARHGYGVSADARDFQPLLALAACLIDVRRFGEAAAVLRAADTETLRGIPSEAVPAILRARMCLARGQLSEAAAEGENALAIANALAAEAYEFVAHSVLGAVALRRGDLEAASGYLAGRPSCMTHVADTYARPESVVTDARIAAARDGPAAAISQIRDICADLPANSGILLGEPSTPAWLVRTALAAGCGAVAAGVADAAGALARENPGFPVITAAAAHSLGLLGQDPAQLAQAAAEHQDPWSRASASEDLGVLYAARADRERAIRYLGEARDGYQQADAAIDQARARQRLRELGVRRRHWTRSAQRSVAGWTSLTEKEQAISELVARGLNNQQIADRQYVSVHTVAFHLRSVFRKLNIGSRVELARIVLEKTGQDGTS